MSLQVRKQINPGDEIGTVLPGPATTRTHLLDDTIQPPFPGKSAMPLSRLKVCAT